jgi:hypothetical protein
MSRESSEGSAAFETACRANTLRGPLSREED